MQAGDWRGAPRQQLAAPGRLTAVQFRGQVVAVALAVDLAVDLAADWVLVQVRFGV